MSDAPRTAPLPARPGTYVLVMRLARPATLRIGTLGAARLRPGFYAYAGSALGPGGIAARVGRHARGGPATHWHIDYLRRLAPAREAWFTTGRVRREHAWAGALARLPGAAAPVPGFGASDCRCHSHLVYFATQPAIAAFRHAVRRGKNTRTAPSNSPNRHFKTIERAAFA